MSVLGNGVIHDLFFVLRGLVVRLGCGLCTSGRCRTLEGAGRPGLGLFGGSLGIGLGLRLALGLPHGLGQTLGTGLRIGLCPGLGPGLGHVLANGLGLGQ